MKPAVAASEQMAASSSKQEQAVSQPADSRVVLRGVALLYESPGGNQVDGLPPVPTCWPAGSTPERLLYGGR